MDCEEVSQKTAEAISNMCPDRGEQLMKLIEDIGTEKYFSAPASSKEQFHNCFPGGLAEHNLNVLQALISLDEICGSNLDLESLCIVAILHDIGKVVNTDMDEFYQLEKEDWKVKRGELYSKNDGSVYLPTHQRSVWLVTKLGFELTTEEYQAILLNDGQYLNENKGYAHKSCTLANLLHMADMIALEKEKRAEKV